MTKRALNLQFALIVSAMLLLLIIGNEVAPVNAQFSVSSKVTLISPDNRTAYIGTMPLNFTVDWTFSPSVQPSYEEYSFSIDGGSPVNVSKQNILLDGYYQYVEVDVSNLTIGYHTIVIHANMVYVFLDTVALRHNSASPPYIFLVQTFPLTIQFFSPQNKTYTNGNLPLNFTTNEPVNWVGYSLDNQENLTLSGNTTLSLGEGPHSIVIYAGDAAGNTGKSDAVFFTVINTTPPPTTTPCPTPTSTPTSNSTITTSPSPTIPEFTPIAVLVLAVVVCVVALTLKRRFKVDYIT